MDDDNKWTAHTVIGALLLVEGLISTAAVFALAASFAADRLQPVAVPVAVHVPVEESWVVKRTVLTHGREEVSLFRTESAAVLILGGSGSTLTNVEPEAE